MKAPLPIISEYPGGSSSSTAHLMLRDRFKSFGYAFKGIAYLFAGTPNAKIHWLFTVAVMIAGFSLEISATEWCLVVGCIAMVFCAEAFNTAIEELTDLVSPDVHPVAGRVKDLAAGAVLFAAMGSAVIGLIIFLPKLLSWFG